MRKIITVGVLILGCNWFYNWRAPNDIILAKHNIHNVPRRVSVTATDRRVNSTVERGREIVEKTVYGTKNEKHRVASRNITYTKILTMTATAYSLTKDNTRSGTRPKIGTISVDPKVIPLGTRLYVEGYGHGTALDTGSAIKGRRLDLWLPSRGAALRFGRKQVRVHVYK